MVKLISRLVDLIPWPERRRAMGDVTLLLLDGKHRVAENVFGWKRSAESLPTVRTISNILNRQDYRLRTVAKTKVQKKPQKPTQSLKTSGR
jgi:hypothetical protein